MIAISLGRAPECLLQQTPKEYVQQLAVCSEALRRARLVENKTGRSAVAEAIAELRQIFNEGES